MAKRKVNPTLKRITTRAKSLQRSHPNTKWTDLIKRASKEIKGKKRRPAKKRRKISAVKYIEKGEKKNVRPAKVYRTVRSKKGTFKGYKRVGSARRTLNDNLRDARNLILDDIARLSTRKFLATRKTDKRKIQKSINAKRSQYKKLIIK